MKIRSTAASLALIAGLGLALAGCGKINEVRAMKAFKDGNKFYAGSHWKEAADKYEEAITLDPNNSRPVRYHRLLYFYLANSYDNMYRPTRKGEPNNDAHLEKAIANYKLAAERIPDPKIEGPVPSVSGGDLRPRQTERPDAGRTRRQEHDRA